MATATMAVTNNSDGTVTIEMTGGDAATLHNIKYAKTTDLAWIALGLLVGNTSFTFTIETGVHWFTSFSGPPSFPVTIEYVASPVMVAITSDETSVFDRILDAVVGEVQSIATAGDLPGLDSTKVVRRDMVFVSDLPFDLPGIVVAPGDQESNENGTNARDDWGYPVEVGILDSKWQKDPSDTGTYLLWRERLRRHFNFRRLALILSGVPEVTINKVIHRGILNQDIPEKGLARFSSQLTIVFQTREQRGA